MPRGLVLFAGSERRLHSHPDSPPTTGGSWDSPSREWLIKTRSSPLGCPWLYALLRSAWMWLFSCWDRWESASWITSTTGSFWPSQRTSFNLTDAWSSATYSVQDSGLIFPRARCPPANEFRSWDQLSTEGGSHARSYERRHFAHLLLKSL